MAGFAGAFVDREAETRGMDFIDRVSDLLSYTNWSHTEPGLGEGQARCYEPGLERLRPEPKQLLNACVRRRTSK